MVTLSYDVKATVRHTHRSDLSRRIGPNYPGLSDVPMARYEIQLVRAFVHSVSPKRFARLAYLIWSLDLTVSFKTLVTTDPYIAVRLSGRSRGI